MSDTEPPEKRIKYEESSETADEIEIGEISPEDEKPLENGELSGDEKQLENEKLLWDEKQLENENSLGDEKSLEDDKKTLQDEKSARDELPESCYVEEPVGAEELERLREFHVLDEVKSNDEDSDDENSDSSEDLPECEIEKMLEEDLPEEFRGVPKPKEKPYVTTQKIVLEEKGVNQFEVLPLDWMLVRHYSGMPVYLHKGTRVCTLSRPYFLGKGSARRHDVPLSAVPCLNYRRALEEEKKQKEIDRIIAEQIATGNSEGDSQATKTITSHEKTNDKSQNNKLEVDTNIKGKVEGSKCPFKSKKRTRKNCEDNTNEANNDLKNSSIENYIIENGVIDNVTENSADDNVVQNSIIKTNVTENSIMVNDDIEEDLKHNIVNNIDVTQDILIKTNITQNSVKNDVKHDDVTDNNVKGSAESDEPVEDGEIPQKSPRAVVLPGGRLMAPPRVATVAQEWQHLSYTDLYHYCRKLFHFKTINIMNFKRWPDRRKYAKARKAMQYPVLPKGTKLITIPSTDNGAGTKTGKRDWVMNMNGCSYLSVFHEYVRLALHKQPTYHFQQLENASCPYQATVYIGGMQYGSGRGSSKRQAKAAAAKASIHILIPDMKDESPTGSPDLSFFDCVGVEDPRVSQFCAACAEPSPHAVLRTCLSRNFGATDRHIQTEVTKLEYQKISLTMKVGKHSATVVCKNKKTAKQRASQAILQALHPHVKSWGSLLRLYGAQSVKTCKEKKMEEQQITLLQDHATENQPNLAVLSKLRAEMLSLRARDAAVVSLGTVLLPAGDLSSAGLNRVQL